MNKLILLAFFLVAIHVTLAEWENEEDFPAIKLRIGDFWTRKKRDGEWVDVLNKFIKCNDKNDAYQRAKEKGGGAKPKHNPPHRPGYYSHYHPGNHELSFENGMFINYHYYYGAPAPAG